MSLNSRVERARHAVQAEASRERHGRSTVACSAFKTEEVETTAGAAVGINLVASSALVVSNIGVECLQLVLHIVRASGEVNVDVSPIGGFGRTSVVLPLHVKVLAAATVCRPTR